MTQITLAHGSGGILTHELIRSMFLTHFGNDVLDRVDDSALCKLPAKDIAFTTDSFVVQPLFFPGGDIGKLSVCGTVNDLAVTGAKPLFLSCSFIIEEGFLESELDQVVRSIAHWAREAGVQIVTGDTKVVERGAADGLFITTAGIGVRTTGKHISQDAIKVGQKIIVSGTVGDHGVAVLSKRKGLMFDSEILSDCAPLNTMLIDLIEVLPGVQFMRDPTRGGVATTLNEIVEKRNFGILVYEDSLPVSEGVHGACELLGLDPLYLANEGKALLIVDAAAEKKILSRLRKHPYGKKAATVGEVVTDFPGTVSLKTRLGVNRLVDMLTGEPIPRIC